MTKEEKIKEAWGEYYEKNKDSIDENGYMLGNYKSYPNIKFDVEDFTYLQPKSLQGIENNNGWIKIESEDDLPNDNGRYWVIHKCDIIFVSVEYFFRKRWESILDVTHYQPIEKPKPPLY